MQIKYLPSAVYKINKLSSNQNDKDHTTIQERLKIIETFDKLKQETSLSDQEICKILDVSRATIYNWKKRYNTKGLQGLMKQSTAPHRTRPSCQTTQMITLVLRLRQENPTYGKAKIHTLLKRDHKLDISQSTTGRILKRLMRQKLINKVFYLFKPKARRVFNKHAKRFEYGMRAKQPGDLVQIDHMSISHKLNFKVKHFAAIDPTTKCLEARGYYGAKSKTAADFLERVIEAFPFKINSVQVDGGSLSL